MAGLVRRWGGRRALDDVTLEVAPGDRVALLGANGAGKTTLLRCLAGLVRPDAGEVEVLGLSVRRARPAVRARLGLLGHRPGLRADLSLAANLQFTARMHGLDRVQDRVRAAAERVGLDHRLHDPVRGFSRGMLQRAGLARVLLPEPEVLLLDEPAGGLDTAGMDVLAGALGGSPGEAGGARTVLLATHDPDRVRAAGVRLDRTVEMTDGRVTADRREPTT